MRIQKQPEWIKGQLYAYTDGSTFRSNPGPISWAVVYVRDGAILYKGNKERSHVGAHAAGTNMRAELMGLIWAVKYETTEDLIVMTDSQVMVKCALGESKRHANKDLWAQYEEFLLAREKRGLITQITHVRGHANDPFNRHVDKMASAHARQNFALTQHVG